MAAIPPSTTAIITKKHRIKLPGKTSPHILVDALSAMYSNMDKIQPPPYSTHTTLLEPSQFFTLQVSHPVFAAVDTNTFYLQQRTTILNDHKENLFKMKRKIQRENLQQRAQRLGFISLTP